MGNKLTGWFLRSIGRPTNEPDEAQLETLDVLIAGAKDRRANQHRVLIKGFTDRLKLFLGSELVATLQAQYTVDKDTSDKERVTAHFRRGHYKYRLREMSDGEWRLRVHDHKEHYWEGDDVSFAGSTSLSLEERIDLFLLSLER